MHDNQHSYSVDKVKEQTMRLIDADQLNIDFYDEYETEDDAFSYGYVSKHQIDSVPTIKTKQVKYFDEDEKVWKIGNIIKQ